MVTANHSQYTVDCADQDMSLNSGARFVFDLNHRKKTSQLTLQEGYKDNYQNDCHVKILIICGCWLLWTEIPHL